MVNKNLKNEISLKFQYFFFEISTFLLLKKCNFSDFTFFGCVTHNHDTNTK